MPHKLCTGILPFRKYNLLFQNKIEINILRIILNKKVNIKIMNTRNIKENITIFVFLIFVKKYSRLCQTYKINESQKLNDAKEKHQRTNI